MKRKIILIAFAAMSFLGVDAQTSACGDFLNRYEKFITEFEALNSNGTEKAKLDSLKKVNKTYISEFKKVKDQMNNDEYQKYYSLKARYQKKLTTIKAKRSASAVKGWIEGVL